MRKLFMKRPTIYFLFILLIGIFIIYLVDIKLFLIYFLIIYLIDSNIKTKLFKKSLHFLDKQNEVKLFSIAKEVGVDVKDFMKKVEVRSILGDEEAIEETKKEIDNISNRIQE